MVTLNNEQTHYCKIMGYSQERALKVLENSLALAMFGELAQEDEQFLEFCNAPEPADSPVPEKNYLSGKETATDYIIDGKTYTRLNFSDEYGERHLWTTESFDSYNFDRQEDQNFRGNERLNSPEYLKKSPDIIVDFEAEHYYSRDRWYDEEELKGMVKQTLTLPSPIVVDNGRCRAKFRPKVVRTFGESLCETEGKGSRAGKQYFVFHAYLAIHWVMVNGTEEVYNPQVYTKKSYIEVNRNFSQLTDKEKEMLNNKISYICCE